MLMCLARGCGHSIEAFDSEPDVQAFRLKKLTRDSPASRAARMLHYCKENEVIMAVKTPDGAVQIGPAKYNLHTADTCDEPGQTCVAYESGKVHCAASELQAPGQFFHGSSEFIYRCDRTANKVVVLVESTDTQTGVTSIRRVADNPCYFGNCIETGDDQASCPQNTSTTGTGTTHASTSTAHAPS